MKSNILISAVLMTLLASSCSSAPKAVPVKVYSEPAGGYVIYRVDRESDKDAPWIYLGTTPVESVLYIEKKTAKKANKLSIRVMKEGYFDIHKDWEGDKIKDEVKERKMLFWNPNLVEQKAK
jgi:hypothetical protein